MLTEDTLPGVWTELAYRQPPPTSKFLETPINLFSDSKTFRDVREVFVRDIRNSTNDFTFEKDGIEFFKHPVDIEDWTNEAEVREVLKRETTEFIKRRLGATKVHYTAERIRQSDRNGAKTDTSPVYAIHGDATIKSGLALLETELPKMDSAPKTLPPQGRVILLNVWRPLKTIKRDPLAFLVPRSIKPGERHAQIFERPADTFKVFGKPIGNYWLDTASHGEQHEWIFMGHQERDEPVMFMQWDSDGLTPERYEQRMSVFHSCFEDPQYVDAEDRTSMELKCLVFFED